MKNDFNSVARFYDTLQKIVFGSTLTKATVYHFKWLQTGSRILIIGGGTGKFLHLLPPGMKIDFLDQSSEMIKLAKARNFDDINYINADFIDFQFAKSYDAIICPFFLDVFKNDNLKVVIQRIHNLLKPSGKLIISDFQNTGLFHHNILLLAMHSFFRIFSRLESQKLQSIHKLALDEGFHLTGRRLFRNKLIFSHIYRN